MVVRIILLTLK